MNRLIPREKLGKKAKKALDAQRRALWEIPPATKRIESKKRYDRKKRSRVQWDDWNTGAFFSFWAAHA